MPTFDDPLADADEASAALRGLARATRTFERPADTYAVIGELLSGVRSLGQVLDQLAVAHRDNRRRAVDDGGDHAVGMTSALAAAEELHQAGVLLDTVERHLDAASQHSGRISWHPAPVPPVGVERAAVATVAEVGSLRLTVWPDEPLGEHQRYAYRIEDTATGDSVEGRDLFTGAGAPVDSGGALRELAAYLTSAGEARQYALDNPGSQPENEGLFPQWVADAARRSHTDLTMLAEREPSALDAEQTSHAGTAARWISVVFLDGAEADEVLDLIRRDGTAAAIEHLAGFDVGEESTQAALENGYVYDTPPTGKLDRTATHGAYTLTYNPFMGHVSLVREYHVEPVLTDVELMAAKNRGTERPSQRPSRAGAEAGWFARPPASTSHGRGFVL